MEHDRPPGDSPTAGEILQQGLRELSLPPELAAPLATLADLLAQWAGRMNLTAHRTPAAIARRLILDALALGEALPVPHPRSLADLGSGAGFPGLPLAIRWPDCRVTLVEARERRHHFQRAVVRRLGLGNAEPLRGRIEDLDPRPHQVVVAQALAQPERAIDWMQPWVAPGGWLALARSAGAPAIEARLDLEDARVVSYRVPVGGPERAIWVARRRLDAGAPPVVPNERPPH